MRTGLVVKLAEAKAIANAYGCTIRYNSQSGEWRVNVRGGNEDTAYYTDDRQDALDTCRAISAERLNRVPFGC